MSTTVDHHRRLENIIRAAVLGITGLSIGTHGDATSVKVAPEEKQVEAQATIDAFNWSDAAHIAWLKLQDRSILISLLSNSDLPTKLVVAMLLIFLDELNLHASKINAILDAADSATTLATFKSAMAVIVDYPQRTKANLVTALTNKINAGDVD